MSITNDDSQSILIRLKSLEAQNRILRLLFISLIVLVTTIGCAELQSLNFSNPSFPEDKILEVEQLIIKDNNGEVRIKIDASDSTNIQQSFYDEGGIERAQISIDPEGSARFRLLDTASSVRFSAVSFSDTNENEGIANRTSLVLLGTGNDNTTNKGGFLISNSAEGLSNASLYDMTGQLREIFGVSEDNSSSHDLYDSSGQLREIFGVSKNNSSNHNLYDSSGTIRHSLGISKNNNSYLAIYDPKGTQRHSIGAFGENSSANQVMYDSNGKASISLYNDEEKFSQRIYDNKGKIRNAIGIFSDGLLSNQILDSSGTVRQEFNSFNNDTNVTNQLIYDPEGNLRSLNYTSNKGSGLINYDSEEESQSYTIINSEDVVSHYAPKSDADTFWGVVDGFLRAKDLFDAFNN